MSDQAMKNQEEVAEINRRFMADEITGQEAVALLQPIADRVNAKAKEIAQKYGMKSARKVKPEATKSHGAKLR